LIKIRWYKGAAFMEQYARFWLIFIVILIYLGGGIFSSIINFVFNFLFTMIGQVFY
jgi:hypothetical protein